MGLLRFASVLADRIDFARRAGMTHGGARDVYKVLGYKEIITPQDYHDRYHRNGVAKRIVEALPNSTWRGGGELVEDEDPNTVTQFEQAWYDLNDRLKIWPVLNRADNLSRIGHFAIVLLGIPGDLDTEATPVDNPEELAYLSVYGEVDVTIPEYDTDTKSPRFGQPLFYGVSRLDPAAFGKPLVKGQQRSVHWSRVLHLADGILDDTVRGIPCLECVWNDLDDLEKVRGGGSEAFWLRANQGLHIDIDPEVFGKLTPAQIATLQDEADNYEHNINRVLETSGAKVKTLGSDVASFGVPIDAIMQLISTGTGIPQRILMGSERGELASTQDKSNWDERIQDRRTAYAGPFVVRPLVDRLTKLGVLPEAVSYDVRWPTINNLDEIARAAIAEKWASLNQLMGETVVVPDEIRDRLLMLEPLDTLEDVTHLALPAVKTPLAIEGEVEEIEPKVARMVQRKLVGLLRTADSKQRRRLMAAYGKVA